MSNVKLQASASGTGTVTIAPPVTNSDLTINLPANSGTVPTIASVVNNGVVYTNSTGAITSSSALTFDGTNLGVGTTSPAYAIHAAGNVNGNVTVASNNTSSGTSAFSRFLALADAGNAQFGMTSSAYTDITGATDALLLNANNASGGMAFALDGVLRMKLDSSGNLGLGVTPSAWSALTVLELSAAGSQNFAMYGGGVLRNAFFNGTNWIYKASAASSLYEQTAGAHRWYTAPSGTAGNALSFTNVLTLEANGNLGVGTTNPESILHVAKASSGGLGAQVILDNTATSALNNAVEISFLTDVGASGSGTRNARIRAVNENAANGNANLQFWTWNGATDAERARITSGGILCVGASSFSAAVRAGFRGDSTSVATVEIQNESATGTMLTFRTNGESQVGSVSFTSGGVTYNTTSDSRLKTLIAPVTGSGARLDALNPIEYEWKANGKRARGFFAHEFQQVYADSVTGEKDAVDEEGKPVYQAMQASTSEVIADLVAEIQSLRARVAALESNP